jgi:hypothetical protein
MYVYATTPPISKTITITSKAIILLFVKTPPIKINYKLFFHVNMFYEHHDNLRNTLSNECLVM